jgi:hypothetical protein
MNHSDLAARLKKGRYGDTAAEILALARSAAELDRDLGRADARTEWFEAIGIHPDTWAKLLGIARAEPLHEPEVADILPASFSTLALLSRCSLKEFRAAISEGLITPKLTHRALAAWRKQQPDKHQSRQPVLRLMPVVIALDPQASEMDELAIQVAIQSALDGLGSQGQLVQIRNWENLDEQVTHQWRLERCKEAVERVNELIRPHSLGFSAYMQPLGELKHDCSELSKEQWGAVYALKNGVDAVFAPTKQKRYASRIRLEAQAEDGNTFASELARALLGRSEPSVAN